jgi:hypothetical protein
MEFPMLVLLSLVVTLLLGLNALRYRHDFQLRHSAPSPRVTASASPSVLPEEKSVTVSQLPASADGRIGAEPALRMLASAGRGGDPRISSSEELLERLQTDGLRVIVPYERVRELRKGRNDGKPRADMVDPVIDAEYSIIEEALAPELAVETVIEPWEHDIAAMAS